MRSAEKGILRRFFGKGIYPSQISFWLDFPLRRLILSPKKLADRLHLKENFQVLEIGPGSGYFSVEVARRIPHGHLELFDLQKEQPGDPDFLPLSVVRYLAEEQGFEFVESYGKKKNYTANFRKPDQMSKFKKGER